MYACEYSTSEIVRELLEKGAEFNAKDNKGYTPLMYICNRTINEEYKKDIFDDLINRGADIHMRNEDGRDAFWFACGLDDINIIKELFRRGLTVD